MHARGHNRPDAADRSVLLLVGFVIGYLLVAVLR